jgi:hypothetical protein
MALVRAQRTTALLALVIAMCALAGTARGGTITLTGTITQSTADLGTTAVANPTLNNIQDGDAYSVLLNFAGVISSPGTFSLSSIVLTDLTHPATEGAFISGSLTLSQSAGVDTFSVFGCLIDSATCLLGNQLSLNFLIPSSGVTQSGVSAQAVPGINPSMDLLEDDGATDIQGTISGYSQPTEGAATPEPSTAMLTALSAGLLLATAVRRKFQQRF